VGHRGSTEYGGLHVLRAVLDVKVARRLVRIMIVVMLVPRNDDAARILRIRAIEAPFRREVPVVNQRGTDHWVIFFKQRL
jgi:hypothetical protein